jgi:excinuclease UvrABC nuclease subunit
LIPRKPGVYLFRDKSGYLYIGEAGSLRTRVSKHLDHSDRKALAHYFWHEGITDVVVELHVFDPDSAAKKSGARRAYESNLIDKRNPRFNIRP